MQKKWEYRRYCAGRLAIVNKPVQKTIRSTVAAPATVNNMAEDVKLLWGIIASIAILQFFT